MKSTYLKFISLFLFVAFFPVLIIIFSQSHIGWTAETETAYMTEDHPTDPNCRSCHQSEWMGWRSSHHQKSMQIANENSVLGRFNNVINTINGEDSRFYKKGNEFWVNLEAGDYKIEYVFGFDPLQQYLIKMDDGKYQTLPLSWDSRDAARGGQRWFHIYGDDHIPKNDRLHWQQPLQNWNGMCADCHSTGLKRNFSPINNQFDTSWDTVNVSCASCHDGNNFKYSTGDDGLGWILEEGTNTASWNGPKRDRSEIEVCAACHSRRAPLTDGFKADDKFLDTFLPSSILAPEYFPDGQIHDEVYVWGSFMQSKMHANGVVCSDCHDPHSLQLKASGNDLCAQCHVPEYFNTAQHHKHQIGSTGAQCINCHMTSQTYMGVDDRRDHSFRIPRPVLSQQISSPDACTSCHTDQEVSWAIKHTNEWTENKPEEIHYGEILNDVFLGTHGAEQKLKAMLKDDEIPEIIRGSGYSLLSNYPNESTAELIKIGTLSPEPLVRLGAVQGSTFIPLDIRFAILSPLLSDEYRAIRVETVRALSDLQLEAIDKSNQQQYLDAEKEFLIAQNQTTWRGEGNFNLGLFQSAKANAPLAEQHYLDAIRIDPYFPASYINLADVYRTQGKTQQNAEMIDRGLSVLPENADLNFSKALHLIRIKQQNEALEFLGNAVKFAQNNAYYSYVYAVALNDLGNTDKSLEVLLAAYKLAQNDGNLNMMLLNHYSNIENWDEALKYVERLSVLFPENEMINRALSDIKSRQSL